MLCLHNYTCTSLYSSHSSSNRCYLSPVVDEEVIHTCVSNLTSSICNSLRVGIVRNCRFSVSFRTDVFMLLFGGKGQDPPHGKGKLYFLDEFSSRYFDSSSFLCYDKLGNGCKVSFPVRLESAVRFSPVCYDKDSDGCLVPKRRSFSESVIVTLLKERC